MPVPSRWLLTFQVVAVSCAVAPLPMAAQAASEADSNECSVYLLLQLEFQDSGQVVMGPNLEGPEYSSAELQRQLGGMSLPEPDRETVANYNRARTEPTHVSCLLNQAETESPLAAGGVRSVPSEQHNQLAFSRIGFNSDSSQALVYLMNSCGRLCSTRYFVLLEHHGDVWTVAGRQLLRN
jgi:hypothetical protein